MYFTSASRVCGNRGQFYKQIGLAIDTVAPTRELTRANERPKATWHGGSDAYEAADNPLPPRHSADISPGRAQTLGMQVPPELPDMRTCQFFVRQHRTPEGLPVPPAPGHIVAEAKWKNGSFCMGRFSDGATPRANGKNVARIYAGTTSCASFYHYYDGNMTRGRLDGAGHIEFANGDIFEGTLRQGTYLRGQYTRNDGSVEDIDQ